MKYRAKGLIDAIQFTGDNVGEITVWLHTIGIRDTADITLEKPEDDSYTCLFINIRGGYSMLEVYAGDYLVAEDGWVEIYGQNYFEATYGEA